MGHGRKSLVSVAGDLDDINYVNYVVAELLKDKLITCLYFGSFYNKNTTNSMDSLTCQLITAVGDRPSNSFIILSSWKCYEVVTALAPPKLHFLPLQLQWSKSNWTWGRVSKIELRLWSWPKSKSHNPSLVTKIPNLPHPQLSPPHLCLLQLNLWIWQ